MRVYHRTPAAHQILADGFRDTEGSYLTDRLWKGVWISDRPLDEGAAGGDVLTLDIPDDVFREYEWVEEGKPNREALIPAHLLNRYGRPAIGDDEPS
jgi:hypothetical protein